MPITTEVLALGLLSISIVGVLWIPITWLLLSILTPKSLMDRYFREPHFTLTETYMMRQFPGSLLRTAMFGWALVLPSMDRKRNIKNVRKYMPLWYAVSLRILTVGSQVFLVLFAVLMLILLLLPAEYGPEHVLFTLPWPF